jgi:hypothetical protein
MTITRRKAKSRVVNEMSEIELGKRFIAASGKISACPEVAVQFPVVGIPGQGKMLVALLREFGRRTAQDYRGNHEVARPQLRVMNALVRELLARRWAACDPGRDAEENEQGEVKHKCLNLKR